MIAGLDAAGHELRITNLTGGAEPVHRFSNARAFS